MRRIFITEHDPVILVFDEDMYDGFDYYEVPEETFQELIAARKAFEKYQEQLKHIRETYPCKEYVEGPLFLRNYR